MATWLKEVNLQGHGVTLEPLRFTLVPRVEDVESYIASALQMQEEGSTVVFSILDSERKTVKLGLLASLM